MKDLIRKYWIPALCAVAFDLLGAVAIMLKIYYSDGEWVALYEIFLQTPLCYFWILWFVMIFFSANGITREYRERIRLSIEEYSLVAKEEVCKAVRLETAYAYSKHLILFFAGLPLLYLTQHYDTLTGFSIQIFILHFIPLLIDLIVLICLYFKRRHAID